MLNVIEIFFIFLKTFLIKFNDPNQTVTIYSREYGNKFEYFLVDVSTDTHPLHKLD